MAEAPTRRRWSAQLTLIVIGFFTLIGVSGTSIWLTDRAQKQSAWVTHTLEVEYRLANVQLFLRRAESTERGFVITGDNAYLEAFNEAASGVIPALDEVKALTGDNEQQRARLAAIDPIVRQRLDEMRGVIAAIQDGRRDEALEVIRSRRGQATMGQISRTFEDLKKEERRLLGSRATEARRAQLAVLITNLFGTALIVLLALISAILFRRATQTLARQENELRVANETLEQRIEERTSDLQEANNELQRFAYIVSHDLRSPLVNIMGFTSELEALRDDALRRIGELKRSTGDAPGAASEEAGTAADDGPEQQLESDFNEALGFIKSSIGKMDRLINAVLKISREGRRQFRREAIDMNKMLQTISDAAAHQAHEAGATVTIERIPPVISDRLALEQVFSNLIDNAIKYLRPSVPGEITVSAEETPARVTIKVADNGRGIAAADRERVFELFRRAGAQDRPGEGIGLAHVRTLVRRVGGSIELESTPNKGSTFMVSLPKVWSGSQSEERGAA